MNRKPTHHQKFLLVNERKSTWTTAFRISFIYLTFGLMWILLSDKLMFSLLTDTHVYNQISTIKGFLFVFISGIIIYSQIAPVLQKLGDKEQVILEKQSELKILLYQDILTGLASRRKLIEHLPRFLEDATSRDKALIYIDIDNIKLLNDTIGHPFGDALITAVAKRLSSILRSPDHIYRLGGDEFVILTAFTSMQEISTKATEMIALFEEPVTIENTSIHTSISVGIALYPLHGKNPDELLKQADIAMYQAKKDGKNRVRLFNSEMLDRIHERMHIGEYLHDAMLRNELEVYYQPQFKVGTRKICGFEALLRWRNPVLGQVSPDRFITIAEETHLIIPIGEWVLWNACRFLKKLCDEGLCDLIISVNVSIIQLLQNDFLQMVKRVLAETGINPAFLELEITESVFMESYAVIGTQLDGVRALGIGIALDDFGKGYSSLSYLEKLPITVLKIDKTFIDGIKSANQDSSITGNIVRIGKKLGLKVVAEGVENETQLEYLTLQQCDRIQGWIFSKALPEAESMEFTRKNLMG